MKHMFATSSASRHYSLSHLLAHRVAALELRFHKYTRLKKELWLQEKITVRAKKTCVSAVGQNRKALASYVQEKKLRPA